MAKIRDAAYKGESGEMRKGIWRRNWLYIIVIAVAFLAGLSACDDYGSSSDQYTEENILMSNIGEYSNRFIYHAKLMESISDSAEMDHGTAPYYPLGIYWYLRMNYGEHRLNFPEGTAHSWYVYTFLLYFLGCMALYGIVYRLFGSRRLSLISFLMYYLSPRFFAEGHYNNKDVVFLSFGLITVYFAMRWIRSRRHLWGVLFAFSAALMTNVKILGVWFFAVPGIVYLITGIREKVLGWEKVLEGLRIILAYILIYIAVTPAIWTWGIEFFRYSLENASSFSRWGGRVVYAGKEFLVPMERVPLDYLPLNILYTTPLIITALFLVGFFRAIYVIAKREKNAVIYGMVLALYLVPFVYALLNKNLVLYNGWRHFYFLYGGIVIFMAEGCRTLFALLKKEWLQLGFGAGVTVYLAILLIIGHPCQYSYINCLARRPAEEDWQLDYWDVSNKFVLEKLYACEDRNKSLELTVTGYDMIEKEILYKDQWDGQMRYISVTPEDDTEKPNYWLRNPVYFDPPAGYHLLFRVEAYGNCLYEVYETD